MLHAGCGVGGRLAAELQFADGVVCDDASVSDVTWRENRCESTSSLTVTMSSRCRRYDRPQHSATLGKDTALALAPPLASICYKSSRLLSPVGRVRQCKTRIKIIWQKAESFFNHLHLAAGGQYRAGNCMFWLGVRFQNLSLPRVRETHLTHRLIESYKT